MKNDKTKKKQYVVYYEPTEMVWDVPELKYGKLKQETKEEFILTDGATILKRRLEGIIIVDSKQLAEKAIEVYDEEGCDMDFEIENFVRDIYSEWLAEVEASVGKEFQMIPRPFPEILAG